MQLSYVRFNVIHCRKHALIKAIKASVTFHGEDNVPLLVFQRDLLFVWN